MLVCLDGESLSPIIILSLSIASFFTSILSGTLGMAGGITLLSFMTFFLPLNLIIPIHGVIQFISNISRSWFLKKHIKWPIFWYFCIGAPLGMLLAVLLIKKLPYPKFFLACLTVSILYALFKPKKLPQLKIPFWGFIFVGVMVGFFGPLIGATGPFLASFFLRDDLDKEEIVATKASTQTIGHLLKIPAFYHLAFPYQDYSYTIIAMSFMGVFGTKVGVMLLGKIDDKIFRILYKTALFAAVLRILYKIIT